MLGDVTMGAYDEVFIEDENLEVLYLGFIGIGCPGSAGGTVTGNPDRDFHRLARCSGSFLCVLVTGDGEQEGGGRSCKKYFFHHICNRVKGSV